MLTKIEALNYRALRYVSRTLESFQVLIGPNASGKSTFLDVIGLMADIVNKTSPTDAIRERTPDFHDLTWMRSSDWLELAVEAKIPDAIREASGKNVSHTHVRYEIRLGIQETTAELALLAETLWLIPKDELSIGLQNGDKPGQRHIFPEIPEIPSHIIHERNKKWRKIVNKTNIGNDYFQAETTNWNNMFRLGPRRSALANLPEDETRFPAAIWFKRHLSEGVQRLVLNSAALRRPSPPQSTHTFVPDGSNLPIVIDELARTAPERLNEWIAHVRTALPDVQSISTIERPEDRHRYLTINYETGVTLPSWSISDGTLRLLALTILAYLPGLEGIYLIEEPENGIHPRAVETVLQSLGSVYDAQVLLATHSPVILSQANRQQLLCFGRTSQGETAIVRGDQHPALQNWRGEVNLSVLFASGVL
ncbi:MAG: methylation-associated defense system AAA family ATPase MAD3 [Aggregatilineales bacterium]